MDHPRLIRDAAVFLACCDQRGVVMSYVNEAWEQLERQLEHRHRYDDKYMDVKMNMCLRCNEPSHSDICDLCWPTCLVCSKPARLDSVRICDECERDLCKFCFHNKRKGKCTCPVMSHHERDRITFLNNWKTCISEEGLKCLKK